MDVCDLALCISVLLGVMLLETIPKHELKGNKRHVFGAMHLRVNKKLTICNCNQNIHANGLLRTFSFL